MNIVKDYYKKYQKDIFNNDNISIDKLISNTQINKTLENFVNLCINYNISLLVINNNKLNIKNNNELLEECRNIKRQSYLKAILKLSEMMDENNLAWLDNKIMIDKISDDLKKTLKDLDIIEDMLLNVYTDKILNEQFKISFNLNKYDFIEEFSNSFQIKKKHE